jgi:uncharacterized phage protein (TIGR02216 family)
MTAPDRRIDWPGLMRAGLYGLGLQPREFWALTPMELAMMLGREGAAPGMSRGALETLMSRFPDGSANADERSTYDRS